MVFGGNPLRWSIGAAAGADERELGAIRQATKHGLPFGSQEFISDWERRCGRPLAVRPVGGHDYPRPPFQPPPPGYSLRSNVRLSPFFAIFCLAGTDCISVKLEKDCFQPPDVKLLGLP